MSRFVPATIAAMATVALLALAPAEARAQSQLSQTIDVGAIYPSNHNTALYGVSPNGIAVGQSYDGNQWQPVVFTQANGLTNLGSLVPGGTSGVAYGVNVSGWVTGTATVFDATMGYNVNKCYLWKPDNSGAYTAQAVDLGTLGNR